MHTAPRILDSTEHASGPDLRVVDDAFTRVGGGWRQGKPLEDPEKTKRWGFVTAKPSEYLIHMRRGRIRRKTTGQGASCFKWPWDSVAIIPTTINRLMFTADQVTVEKVGMRVTGLAVFRIVEPELTFRMLNFSYSERAQEKLSSILREMFVGATRRHVANLTVDDVMTRRKDAIASELMSELAPVVEGHGRADDTTATGWGVILDTVEVQDVRVLSESVFENMQAEFRAELARRAREAELSTARDVATREADTAREIEQAKIASDAATREQRALAETRTAGIEVTENGRREALRAAAEAERITRARDQQIARLRAEAEVAAEQARQAEAAHLAELAREQALALARREAVETQHATAQREAELEAERAAAAVEAEDALREQRSLADTAIRRRELELQRIADELETALTRARRDIENTVSEDRIQQLLVEHALPQIARAFAGAFGDVRLTQIGGAVDPAGLVGGALDRIAEFAQAIARPGAPSSADASSE